MNGHSLSAMTQQLLQPWLAQLHGARLAILTQPLLAQLHEARLVCEAGGVRRVGP